jgi:hypothetical protein
VGQVVKHTYAMPTRDDLTPLVRAVLERRFRAVDRPTIASLLAEQCACTLPLVREPAHAERIQLAVLKLAQGRVDALLYHLAQAQLDWRDVLVAADFGNDLQAHLRWAAEVTA